MPTLPTTSDLPPSYIYEYRGAKLIAVAVAFIPLEILLVGLRYYSRYVHKGAKGLDDILVALALVFCLVVNAIAIGQSKSFSDGILLLLLDDEIANSRRLTIFN